MATKKSEGNLIKARVLGDCAYGKQGDVIEIEPVLAEGCMHLDADPAAVAYAEAELAAKATPAAE